MKLKNILYYKSIFIIFFLIIILYYIFNISIYKEYYWNNEYYCNKISSTNSFGAQNNKDVDLTYGPQDNIKNNNCDKYWKEFPNEYNTDFLEDIPLDRNSAYNVLPSTAQFGNNSYAMGLIDYTKLIPLVNEDPNIILQHTESMGEEYEEKLLNPLTGVNNNIKYEYELKYDLYALNKKTWIHRAKEFDPTKKNTLSYNKIKSPIDDINKLNTLFINRLNEKQKSILSNNELITFGTTDFYIYKYAIQSIHYNKSNNNHKLYTIKVVIFRENDVYTPTIFYQGIVDNSGLLNKSYKIINATYIGSNESSQYLMNESAGLRKSSEKYYMLNSNYRHDDEDYYRDVNKEVAKRKDYLKQFDLKEAYACFNTDFKVYLNPTHKSNIILPYLSRQQCETPYDFYGRVKPKGIFDKPCKNDNECPFFKANKNYPNNRGKCLDNGQCELPVNMIPIGYHFFVPHPDYTPMCYNCDSKSNWNASTKLNTCCDTQAHKANSHDNQFHKKIGENKSKDKIGTEENNKYTFLNSPDYAFIGDIEERSNHYNQIHNVMYPNQNNKIVVNNM